MLKARFALVELLEQGLRGNQLQKSEYHHLLDFFTFVFVLIRKNK